MKRFLYLAVWIVFLAVPSWAQADRATLTGTVSDPSQAVIAGVTVTATNLDTKVQSSATTNEVGIYRILNLPVGQYSILFKKDGFESLERTGITLTISQVAEINVTLKLGAVAQTVEVNAQAPVLQSQTNDTGSTMTLQAYRALPLTINGGRDIMAFAFAVTPGVEGNSWTSYISGTQAFSNEVLIDGTLAQESETGQLLESEPPMEAVQEFRVDTGGMSGQRAMYTAGGTFSFIMKSGTNQFHGSAATFWQNEAFNANSWMNNYYATPRPRSRHKDYTFSAGGPIIKNKTFIFGAFEQYRKADYTAGSADRTVPTPDFLQGNFSALLDTSTPLGTDAGGNTIYKGAVIDPTTGLVFPNNTIPSNRFSKVAQQIIPIYQQYYKPLGTGLLNNNAATDSNNPWFHQTQFSLKVDHNFSEKNRLASSYIWTARPRVLVDAGGIWSTLDPNGGPLAMSRMQKNTDQKFRLSDSYNLTPSVLNVLSFTLEHFRNPSLAMAASGNWPSKLGFVDTGAGNFPQIDFGNTINGFYEDPIGYNSKGFYTSNVLVGDETLTWIKGRHTMTFGGELRAFQINSHGGNGTLNFDFSNNQTGAPTQSYASQVGFGFASFLLGDVSGAHMGTPYDLYGRRKSLSLFAEDSFRVNSRFTLNYGLNWNQTYPFHEKYGHWASFDGSLKDPATGMPGQVAYLSSGGQTFEGSTRWSDFAPHIGFAYKLHDRLVARAAYAMFYVPIGIDYWSGVPYGFAPGYFPTNEVPQTQDFSPAFNWDNGYPGQPVSGTLDPNYMTTQGMVSISQQSLRPGITNQWNGGVEFELTPNTRLSVNYLGTRGTHLHDPSLQQNTPQNSVLSNLLKSGHEWDWVWDQGSAAAAGVPYPYDGFSNYAFAAIYPYPQLAANWAYLFYVGSPLGRSQYDALQAEIVQRSSHGLTADLSYTLAHQRSTGAFDYGTRGSNFQETWVSDSWLQNLSDLSWAANNIQPYNQHIVKGYILYTLPFGNQRQFLSGRGRVVNAIVGNWTLGTTLYYSTGTPLSVYSYEWYPGPAWGAFGIPSTIYSNVAAGADLSRHFNGARFGDPSNYYFNPAGFSDPGYGNFGNSGPYVAGLNGFGTASENLSLYKDFKIKERMKLQIRAEFFNVFNRHTFNNPNTSLGSNLGQVLTASGSPRVGQLGARFEW
ncbi:MAG: TonB-dependent receptor [Acidobacteriia bacterium]|nr:TonB-dependent receptor [Terriglobia bacterium]